MFTDFIQGILWGFAIGAGLLILGVSVYVYLLTKI